MGLANAAAVGVGFRRRRGKVSPWASRGAVTPPALAGGWGGGYIHRAHRAAAFRSRPQFGRPCRWPPVVLERVIIKSRS